MKLTPFALLLLITCAASSQKIERFYTFEWKECDVAHARFNSVAEHTDSGWHRTDYFVHGPTIQMDGWYEDTTWKVKNGRFVFAYPDKKIQSAGRYVHGKKEGLWMTYHYNGMPSDSTVYADGHPIGTSLRYYPDGILKDSNTWHTDGSAVLINWHKNGNVSAAGMLGTDGKKIGKWQFWHDNGRIAAVELYDHGELKEHQYFDESGQPVDTAIQDRKAMMAGGQKAWSKYLDKKLYWPANYQITNSDQAALVITCTVNADGTISDLFVSTPFFPPFEKIALDVIRRSPKWEPAIEHNRRVPYYFNQPVVFNQISD